MKLGSAHVALSAGGSCDKARNRQGTDVQRARLRRTFRRALRLSQIRWTSIFRLWEISQFPYGWMLFRATSQFIVPLMPRLTSERRRGHERLISLRRHELSIGIS